MKQIEPTELEKAKAKIEALEDRITFYQITVIVITILMLFSVMISCSPNLSKHQNDSVADRLRQRHAPVKAFKPNLK